MDGQSAFFATTTPDDAILRAVSAADLCQNVCRAVIADSDVVAACILLAEPGEALHYAAGAGYGADALAGYGFSVVSEDDLAVSAFRRGQLSIAAHYAHDALVQRWKQAGIGAGAGAAAAFPLLCAGTRLGVMLIFLAEAGDIPADRLAAFERLTGNAAFRLDALRRQSEKDRLTDMFKALSASNEAILRAETRERLFQLVCEAAVKGGKFIAVVIALRDPENGAFRVVNSVVGGNGVLPEPALNRIKLFGKEGLTGIAAATGRPAVSNDYQADARMPKFAGSTPTVTLKSGAALPLIIHGQSVGVLLFVSGERNCYTPEFVELLQRLAANLSFALENFDRAEAKAEAEARIKYLATHDNLTGLPNRVMFTQLLDYAVLTAGKFHRPCAVLFIDLDRFKVINDSLGHAAGDTLLTEMGNRLRRSVRGSDIVARLGGDEFMILLNEISGNEAISAIANDLLTALARPLTLSGQECRVTASIGIARFPEDAADGDTLMKHADAAMYVAKSEGKNDVRFFSPRQKSQNTHRLLIESSLRQALDRGELLLHYQPKRDVATSRIAGVEALLRWTHPELGMLPPAQFIPIAEEIGMIVPIGRWVLATACAQAMAWQRAGLPPLSMAVNVSPRQFSDPNLLRDIDAALAGSGLPPNLLQVEITESMVMLNVERAIAVLDAIQSRGVRLAIDDFGTGYSSMSTLKRFPIDTIKIDRSFIRDLPQNAEDRAITQAIINMGKALGLTIVAEGVETIEQDEFLRTHQCDEVQGFLFGKPVPPERIFEFF